MFARKNELEAERILLLSIIEASDAHACKCAKLGISFKETYPEELEEYKSCVAKLNEIEDELATLETEEDEDIFDKFHIRFEDSIYDAEVDFD